jgi:ABC-type Fe3+-hydroxamate transport system substrate-binding protein
MPKITRIIQYVLIFLLIVVAGGCASSSKSSWEKKRKTAARTNTAQVGRNKFFYSTNYQKKLGRTYRNKR